MEKQWIVIPTWKLDRHAVERWNSLVKYHKYKGEKHLDKWDLKAHFQCSGWWTHSQKYIPLEEDEQIIITILWNLTPEKGWLSTYAMTIEYKFTNYYTHIDPQTADRMIHWKYLPCFTEQAIRQALLGKRLTVCYFHWGHKGKVGSLQYLALLSYTAYCNNGRRGPRDPRRSRRGGSKYLVGKISGENQSGGKITLPPRVPFPSLERMHRTLA
ncbi:vif protein [Simian immunodeficiency virus SIV-mnd 2]|uniref:Virion infectivity factor n=1 Tax=Simian immunodeficiency virus SIV-mnd 2 TaxID=159122 RepID=Q8AII8_SIV|nr:vif protein [Simian immunodeficiency virus SIV-mnd 2]AAN85709.1 vif protein [Simian immunodeficiency virus SIV-mnd 2]